MEENESLFVQYFGDSPFVKVLDFLIENDVFDYSVQDISEATGLARNTVSKIVEQMEKRNMVSPTRTVGRAKMFQLNRKDPIVAKLVAFDYEISVMMARKVEGKKELVVA